MALPGSGAKKEGRSIQTQPQLQKVPCSKEDSVEWIRLLITFLHSPLIKLHIHSLAVGSVCFATLDISLTVGLPLTNGVWVDITLAEAEMCLQGSTWICQSQEKNVLWLATTLPTWAQE